MALSPSASSFSMAKLPSWPFGLWAVIATAVSYTHLTLPTIYSV